MQGTRLALGVMAALLLFPGLGATGPVPADDQVVAKVEERVKTWWPRPEEKRFDQIGWAADIHSARRLAAEHNRPVFLFTMDGRVNLGRC